MDADGNTFRPIATHTGRSVGYGARTRHSNVGFRLEDMALMPQTEYGLLP